MNVPPSLRSTIESFLTDKFSTRVTISGFKEISGGCINTAGKLITSNGIFFVKWNLQSKCPGMFEAEAKGLALLSAANAFYIPTVLGTAQNETHQIILLSFIDDTNQRDGYWKMFGRKLAQLHQTQSAHFGLDHNNYIGSLPQVNHVNNSWIDFLITTRLNAQVEIAVDNGMADNMIIGKFEKLYRKLSSLLPNEKASLLHGDLWRGNLITSQGAPCLIDPAVYYGHREVDIAMTQLFGGFDPSFLSSYNEVFPLEKNWLERIDLYNLYPLLVHLNLFGQGYLSQILNILKRFV
ncbi:fructosamine kinase family protein [Pseudochryseolinea flava]|uniref:Ketosamine-3-kinase n=1 Tax=Pseudochryseolinea flava TaxID=2059302 RepID=A0A364Y8L6_9BACT|nr:fructosamine kinase family protein [Pseudochryseolinea flava]RAW03253.1 ketosamine-3-kinase [Pseudochryseolinea flava]